MSDSARAHFPSKRPAWVEARARKPCASPSRARCPKEVGKDGRWNPRRGEARQDLVRPQGPDLYGLVARSRKFCLCPGSIEPQKVCVSERTFWGYVEGGVEKPEQSREEAPATMQNVSNGSVAS